MSHYVRRLIEVDLPIREISAHARREKSLRHGHISTLHIWWARRPLAACRAVLCASLWPDPADEHCPGPFRHAAAKILSDFADKVRTDKHVMELCAAHWPRWRAVTTDTFTAPTAMLEMRGALLDFIADFSNWDAATAPDLLRTARLLTEAASLGGGAGARPLVVDPFAGGGAIPLEALRVGADAYASDLNPVAVLLNKVVIEYAPRHGQALADAVRKWGHWARTEAAVELTTLYPVPRNGTIPVAYLWARTVTCEGPGCGVDVPLLRSRTIARRGAKTVALQLVGDAKASRIEVGVLEGAAARQAGPGTVRLGAMTCPLCGYTTPVERVRAQLRERHGGAQDARLLCVVSTRPGESGRVYRVPSEDDLRAVRAAREQFQMRAAQPLGALSTIPNEPTPPDGTDSLGGGYRTQKYGITTFGEFFTPRQALALVALVASIRRARDEIAKDGDSGLALAVSTCLALAVDRQVDAGSSLCRWHVTGEKHTGTFGRHALPMIWDFSEVPPLSGATGGFSGAVEWVAKVCEATANARLAPGQVVQASATEHPLPDDVASAIFTDPPYYDAVPYGELSDFFYVWLRRSLGDLHPDLFATTLVPKGQECIVNLADRQSKNPKDRAFFERTMRQSLLEARRIARPDAVAIVVFAHKSTEGWEAQLQALIEAGWVVTASWPIDTEMGSRLRAQNSAALASSIHLVCRPRAEDGQADGSWRAVLAELPERIHAWMPRLAAEGVVGADAIFACLGPALEVFSRYSRVEKASGEVVTLKEYLEHVWAAVSKEALSTIFKDADAAGLEEDARLTAMWLWTLSGGANGAHANEGPELADADEAEDDQDASNGRVITGFVLEFDAARKIAQGLGAHLELLADIVEVKGSKARLLPVSERAKHLFARDDKEDRGPRTQATRKKKQLGLFAEIEAAEKEGLLGDAGVPKVGETTLDRVHQSMILFAAGRSEALKRFVVEEGVGQDSRFWKLAQCLSALYPAGTDEKRWVDGVLTRKKSLGF